MMAIPQTIRVKLSSEEAGSVSITGVVVRDIPLRELVTLMLGITGKDAARVHDLLRRGTLVSGATRYRWQGWDAGLDNVAELLETFPRPDPSRPFSADHCVRAVIQGPGYGTELPRELGVRRRLFRRRSFWSALMEVADQESLRYIDYSYKEKADCYRVELSLSAAERLRGHAGLVRYPTLENQIRSGSVEAVDLFVEREPD